MSARRIAVLVGSHDPAYFARYKQPDRPSEAAVLTALRAKRSTSQTNHRASATPTPTDHVRSIAPHARARAGAGSRRTHVPDSGGPPRIVCSPPRRAREGRPATHARASSRAGPPALDAEAGRP
jgi:hypothetical protein